MFPFVIDHRSTMEPSISLYHCTKSAFRANSRGKPSKPSKLATPGMTTSSPTMASQFPGLHYNPKPPSTSDNDDVVVKDFGSPPPYSSRQQHRRRMPSSASSDSSSLSIISESDEEDAERLEPVRRVSTMTKMKQGMSQKLNFLRRRSSTE